MQIRVGHELTYDLPDPSTLSAFSTMLATLLAGSCLEGKATIRDFMSAL